MNILIIGVSSATSIGAVLGARLTQFGHAVFYASRTGSYSNAFRLDISHAQTVQTFFSQHHLDLIFHCAGVYCTTARDQRAHARAKILGYKHLLAFARSPVFVLGGALPLHQHDRHLSFYAKVNKRLLFSMQCHNNAAYYLALPTITGSTMAMLHEATHGRSSQCSLPLSEVADFLYPKIISSSMDIH